MKAISIKQPWASLIAHGIKDIENRTWKCPQKYIGKRVLIVRGTYRRPYWRLISADRRILFLLFDFHKFLVGRPGKIPLTD